MLPIIKMDFSPLKSTFYVSQLPASIYSTVDGQKHESFKFTTGDLKILHQ